MRKLSLILLAALAFATPCAAQHYGTPLNTGAQVVTTCGTQSYAASDPIQPVTQDTTGALCTGVAGGATAAKQNTANTSLATIASAVGTIGSAVPPGGAYLGANVGGNLTGVQGCGSSVVYDASTNGATQLVGLVSNQIVYVCGYTIFAAGTVNVELDYGTGTACATGNNKMTPAFQLTAQTGAVDGSPFYRGLKTIASNELCIKTSAGVAVQAIVYYDQH